MPRVYKKKGLRWQWELDDLNNATAEIKDGVFTVRAASWAYGITRTSLQQYVNAKTTNHQVSTEDVVGRTAGYLAQFEELAGHAKRLSELFFSIKLKNVDTSS